MPRLMLVVALTELLAFLSLSQAFTVMHHPPRCVRSTHDKVMLLASAEDRKDDDVLNKAIAMMSSGGAGFGEIETPDMTQARLQSLVDQHKVLLFMKGAKSFPQCGFSDTATKVLDRIVSSKEISGFSDYHTIDVLADPMVRDGIKVFSQWPTIPQLYVGGEFIGGSDVMLEMFQSGELKELIQKMFLEESS